MRLRMGIYWISTLLIALSMGSGGVAELMRDHETVLATIRSVFAIAEVVGDEATMDLLNARTAAHDKHAWMLRATLDVK